MRALRRIATPASVGLAFLGCSLPVDDFQPPNGKSGPIVGNTGDADTVDAPSADAPAADAQATDAAPATDSVTTVSPDAATDACVCVKVNGGGKCKEWSPPGCGG